MFARFSRYIHNRWYGTPEEKQPLLADEAVTSVAKDQIPNPFSVYKCAYIGLGRDFWWALAAYNNWDFVSRILKATGVSVATLERTYVSSIICPWTTQLVIAGAGLTMSTCSLFDNPEYRNAFGKKVLMTYALASLLSLIPWNVAQMLGFQLGKKLGMTDHEANAFAAIFTAVVEGLIQYGVIATGTRHLKKQMQENAENSHQEMIRQFHPEDAKKSHSLLDLLAAIPAGGVWQLMYVALLEIAADNLGLSLLTSLGVGVAVATTTIVVNIAIAKLKNVIDHCGVNIEDESKHEHHQHADLYGGMV